MGYLSDSALEYLTDESETAAGFAAVYKLLRRKKTFSSRMNY